jgi:hypothetical protein
MGRILLKTDPRFTGLAQVTEIYPGEILAPAG